MQFELRVTVRPVRPYRDGENAPRDFYLRRTVTVPCDFVPTELDLWFGKYGDTKLLQAFKIASTRWDEREQKLIAFAEVQEWLVVDGQDNETLVRRCEHMGEFGWERWNP